MARGNTEKKNHIAGEERITNLVPSTGVETDWTLRDAVAAGALTAPALPNEVDLREAWWEIGDQRATGSCVGWAAGDGLMRYHLVKAGLLDKDEHVSPRYVWMGSKETDENLHPAGDLHRAQWHDAQGSRPAVQAARGRDHRPAALRIA